MVNEAISVADTEELKLLRQAWYNTVYSSLEKLDKRVDNISEAVLTIKNELKNEIEVCKQKLTEDFDSFGKSELTFTLSLKNISSRLNLLENSSIKEELKGAIKEIEDEVGEAKDVLGKRRDSCVCEFTKIRERLATIETKIWVFASIVGGVVSVITTIVIYLVKGYLKG